MGGLAHSQAASGCYRPAMLRALRDWFTAGGSHPESSRAIIGSTGSGKSEGELVDLVRLADRGRHAVVVLDPHGPLAFRAAGHWAGRGHEARLVYEPLDATDRVLCWDMLPRARSGSPAERRLRDDETRDEVAQCFLAYRDLATLADRPLTREWLEAAVALCQSQPAPEPLGALLDAFRVGTPACGRLLRGSDRPDVVEKFAALERVRRRSELQYEGLCGAARRLVEPVCASEPVRLRARPGPFDWLTALRERRLVAFDGGGVRSREVKRTLFLLAGMGVIHAVRRHFAETRHPLPVILVLEEAGALGLVTPFVLSALQELRKAGLAVHVITQSSLDFGDRGTFEAVLANTPWQAWYQCLAPADQELGARALANAAFDAHAVHFTRTRQVRDGVEHVETESRGEAADHHGHVRGHDHRTGTAFLARYREAEEPHYKTPQLQEQEYRTRLATLRIGERLVRDRSGVRPERVKALRTPRRLGRFEAATRDAIERVRRAPIYLPAAELDRPHGPPAGAAARLRGEIGDGARPEQPGV